LQRQNQKQLADEVQALLSLVALKRLQKSFPPFLFSFRPLCGHATYGGGLFKGYRPCGV